MTIETEFNVGDTVYVMFDNRVVTGEVASIKISIDTPNSSDRIYYLRAHKDLNGQGRRENQLFATKQELLDSL